MSKYAELDEAILGAIKNGCEDFHAIQTSPRVSPLSWALAKPDRWGSTDPWRVIDRRLQALRKAGRIVYANRKWSTSLT